MGCITWYWYRCIIEQKWSNRSHLVWICSNSDISRSRCLFIIDIDFNNYIFRISPFFRLSYVACCLIKSTLLMLIKNFTLHFCDWKNCDSLVTKNCFAISNVQRMSNQFRYWGAHKTVSRNLLLKISWNPRNVRSFTW